MPHTKTAEKRLRQNEKRRLRNKAAMKTIKLQLRKVLAAAKAGNLQELEKENQIAAKKLDKAAARRVIHPNLAARKKSQLARLMNQKKKTAV